LAAVALGDSVCRAPRRRCQHDAVERHLCSVCIVTGFMNAVSQAVELGRVPRPSSKIVPDTQPQLMSTRPLMAILEG
jgi:hypothetical protein